MRVFLTGGTGFVGGALARHLRTRGNDVVALARDARPGEDLKAIGCDVVIGELPETDLTDALVGVELLIHAGGQYRIGIRPTERPAMYRANVDATRAVLEQARSARVPRIVYVSTVGVFGDTHGTVVGEDHRRPPSPYVSYYDETKFVAHELVEQAAAAGAPVVIAMPSQVYGPGDHSGIGDLMHQAAAGRLRAMVLPDAGVCMVHVDNLADGILRVAERGRLGASYVLAGECVRLRDLIDRVASITGRRPPRVSVPTWLLRVVAPAAGLLGTNLAETVRTGDGVTFWASSHLARRELGWEPRSLDDGLRELFAHDAASRTI